MSRECNKYIDIGNGFTISLQSSKLHYCTPGETVEMAIFLNGEWYTGDTGIPSLEKKADGESRGSGVRVFGHVTLNDVVALSTLLGNFTASKEIKVLI